MSVRVGIVEDTEVALFVEDQRRATRAAETREEARDVVRSLRLLPTSQDRIDAIRADPAWDYEEGTLEILSAANLVWSFIEECPT